MRKYFPHLNERSIDLLKQWERIFLEEGAEGLSSCGRAKEREKALIVSGLRQKYPLTDRTAQACPLGASLIEPLVLAETPTKKDSHPKGCLSFLVETTGLEPVTSCV